MIYIILITLKLGKEHQVYNTAAANNIKLIYGIELCCKVEKKRHYFNLLAKNKQGLKDIYRLFSEICAEHPCLSIPYTSLESIEGYRKNILVGMSISKDDILSIFSGQSIENIISFYDYIMLRPISQFAEEYDTDKLKALYFEIISLCRKLGKTVAASDGARMADANLKECRNILLHHKGHLRNNEPALYLCTTEEMLDEFSFLPQELAVEIVVKNTNHIAEMIEDAFCPYEQSIKYPEFASASNELKKKAYKKANCLHNNNLDKITLNVLETDDIAKLLKDMFSHNILMFAGNVSTLSASVAAKLINAYCIENNMYFSTEEKEYYKNILCRVKRSDGTIPCTYFVLPQGYEIDDFTPTRGCIGEFPITHFNADDLRESLIDIKTKYHAKL